MKTMMSKWLVCGRFPLGALLLWLIAGGAFAGDWQQYNGPLGNRSSDEALGVIDWSQAAPTPIWRVTVTNGFSSFSIAGGRTFTLVSRKDNSSVKREACIASDAVTGTELWAAFMGTAAYDSGGSDGASGNTGGDGPRATPTTDGVRVYVLDAHLGLYCFNAASGQTLWKQDIIKDYAGRNIGWQSAASPLLEGETIVVPGGGAGQSFLAFDRTDGHLVWKALDEKMTHATPVATTIQGVRQIIFFAQSGLVAVAAANGALLWRYPFPYSTATGASPVVSGDYIYCSAGYGVGAGLCHVVKNGTQWQATEVWQKKNTLMNQWSTPVIRDGYLYGLFGAGSYGSAPLQCVELLTGTVKWSQSDFGQGNLILAGNHLVVLSDAGDIVVVETNPTAYRETARATMLSGKCWSTPALSNNRIYARSTTEGVCFEFSHLVKAGVSYQFPDAP